MDLLEIILKKINLHPTGNFSNYDSLNYSLLDYNSFYIIDSINYLYYSAYSLSNAKSFLNNSSPTIISLFSKSSSSSSSTGHSSSSSKSSTSLSSSS